MNIQKQFSKLYLQETELEQLESVVRVLKNSEILVVQVAYNVLLEAEDETRGMEVAQKLFDTLNNEGCGYKHIKVVDQEELFHLTWASLPKSTYLVIKDVDLTHPKWETMVNRFQNYPSIMKVVISKPVACHSFFYEQILNKHITIQNMDEEQLYLAYKDMVTEEGIPVSNAFSIRMKYFIQHTSQRSPLKNFAYIDFIKNKMYQEIFSRPIEELKEQAKSRNNVSIVQEVLDKMDLSIQSKETSKILDAIYGLEGLSSFKQSIQNMDQILTFDILHKTTTPIQYHKVFIGEAFIGKKYACALYAQYLYSMHVLLNESCAICDVEDEFSFIKENEGKLIVLENIGQGEELVNFADSLEKRTILVFLSQQSYEYSFAQSIRFDSLTKDEWENHFIKLSKEAGYEVSEDCLNKIKESIETLQSQKQFQNWKTIQEFFHEITQNCALEAKENILKKEHFVSTFEKKALPVGPFNQNFKNNSKKRKK